MMNKLPLPAPASAPDAPPADLLGGGASLFLDFDGTLVELAPTPDAVRVDDRLGALVAALERGLGGRLALVSGRSVAQIRTLFAGRVFSISGSHGVELDWADGRTRPIAAPAWLGRAVREMQAFVGGRAGLLVEVKPFGVALHYRQAPDAEAACHRLAESLGDADDIHVQKGKMMVELRMAGADKGDAVRAFMADPLMAGTRPVFLGDDLTDEPAFVAAAALGGTGVLIGPPRETAAQYRLPDVAASLAWLETAAEALA